MKYEFQYWFYGSVHTSREERLLNIIALWRECASLGRRPTPIRQVRHDLH
jgi:hypothetical protein